jgi:type II secretory pathway pseudopilin PulG
MGQHGTVRTRRQADKARDRAARPVAFGRRVQAGFTLAELFVILGIIVTLAGMLIPSFASAQRSARLAACASNMHAIGIGLRQYASINQEQLPPFAFADFDANLPQSSHWGGSTQPNDPMAGFRPVGCSPVNLWALMPECYLAPKHVICPGAPGEVRNGSAGYFPYTTRFSTYSLRTPYSLDLFRTAPKLAGTANSLMGVYAMVAGGQGYNAGMALGAGYSANHVTVPQARMDMPYAETPPGGTERTFQYVSGAVLSDTVWFDKPVAATAAPPAGCSQYPLAARWCHANKFNVLFGGGDARTIQDDGALARAATASHSPAKDKDNFATPYLAAWRYFEDHK